MVDEHPLPWLAPLLNGVEHANFFETRATEYSKAATRGHVGRGVQLEDLCWGPSWSSGPRASGSLMNMSERDARGP